MNTIYKNDNIHLQHKSLQVGPILYHGNKSKETIISPSIHNQYKLFEVF